MDPRQNPPSVPPDHEDGNVCQLGAARLEELETIYKHRTPDLRNPNNPHCEVVWNTGCRVGGLLCCPAGLSAGRDEWINFAGPKPIFSTSSANSQQRPREISSSGLWGRIRNLRARAQGRSKVFFAPCGFSRPQSPSKAEQLMRRNRHAHKTLM